MKIKNGYNNKETEINIYANSYGRIELWIAETGKDDKTTLTYITPNELFELHQMIKKASKILFSNE